MATQRTTGSLTITVETSCVTGQSEQITIEIDEDLNANTSCFVPNQDIFLRMYTSPTDLEVEVDVTYGDVYLTGAVGYSDHEEYVTIQNGEGNADYPIHTLTSKEWHGDAPCDIDDVQFTSGYPQFSCPSCTGSPDGGDACTVTYGVLKVVYQARYRKMVLNVPGAGEVIVYAYEVI